MAAADSCFHCALPIPNGAEFNVIFETGSQPVCCPGCKAVAELIRDAGLDSYYAQRETPAPGVGRPPDTQIEWQVFNTSEMLQAFADIDGADAVSVIYVGGMYCSACSWLIETSLSRFSGVTSVEVNPVTHRVRVCWLQEKLGLGDILSTLANLGYQPQPLSPGDNARPEVAEQRAALKRLLVASLGMMQVMMFAVGLYAGDFQGMDADMQRFLRLVSFLVTTPVVFYAARPFFLGAWRGVRARLPGMDLPVSLAIGAAYAASVYATFTTGPAVWFDSVVMFVFFLTLGRYLEMRARHRAIDRSAALAQLLPSTATRVLDDQRTTVPIAQLVAGDTILVRNGDSIPADGRISKGQSNIDESLLTGESEPRRRGVGDEVIAGSINLDGVIEVCVERTGGDTALGAISRLSEQARFARPGLVTLADRIASYVVIALLVIAGAVALFWYIVAPENAFVITLSVLVVTCPCALALATPAAFAAAGSRLSQSHLLLTRGDAIEAMSRATHFVFDKTGTLTCGMPVVHEIEIFDESFDENQCLQIAAALEQDSSHPIARAFQGYPNGLEATKMRVHIAAGISGSIDEREWRIGNADFACKGDDTGTEASTYVYLGTAGRCVARFEIRDRLRPDARETVEYLRSSGIRLTLASGDNDGATSAIARTLGIDQYHSGCTPEGKLAVIRSLQDKGDCVVMVGDGINDAPVLAGADASIAPSHGAELAQTSADLVLVGDSLKPLMTAVGLSRKTMRIVRQNLVWAVIYNVLALPLAAAGMVPPWLAAIGMSTSSLVVVLNALRLNRYS